MIRILAADGIDPAAKRALIAKGFEVVDQYFEADQLGKELENFDAVVVRSATKIRQPIIDQAVQGGRLKLIVRAGVGMDNIDVDYARERGISVTNTPGASSASVAELALCHMFAMARFIGIANVTMRQGEWNKKQYEGIELGGRTLGLVGMGRIAQELAKRAQALGMKVIYTDILGENKTLPYRFCTLDEVLQESDFVSLHTPASPDQKPILGAAELACMKQGAFVLNTARGGLIDENALCDALDSGMLSGATLDVFVEEPTHNQRVLQNPKISMTPHIGASTKEAQQRIGTELVEIITDYFK